MAGGAYREHPFEAEVPFYLREEERQDKAARGCVDVDRDVVSGFGVVGVERFVERFNIIVEAGPGYTLDGHDADGVFVAHLQSFLRVECGFLQSQRHRTHLNLP